MTESPEPNLGRERDHPLTQRGEDDRRQRNTPAYVLDRFWGPYVAIVFFGLPMIGIAILISGTGGFAPFLGAIACGLGIGAP